MFYLDFGYGAYGEGFRTINEAIKELKTYRANCPGIAYIVRGLKAVKVRCFEWVYNDTENFTYDDWDSFDYENAPGKWEEVAE